ncbi:MAG: RagB/SusD family nutrient uptake outer membrane protein [Pseudosphingobacterium sp.]|nr:RagB/SusD family nutrient uptake outer membrane protein [Pseudosphingobacterium sp.]
MKIRYIYLTFAMLVFLSACEKKLDLLPQQDLTEELVFSSPETTLSALRGVYSTTQTLEFYGSMPQVIADYMADNVDFIGTFPTLQQLNDFASVSTNSSVYVVWEIHYQVITRANKVIANVPNVEGLSDELKAQYIAEAKFLRALAYFQLVNFFAQPFQVSNGNNLGVPLVLEDFTGEVTYPSRSSLNEVHAQILKDLEEAVPALPSSYESASDTRGRATKGAAHALLSRLYLYREEWAQVVEAANNTLEQGIYDLAADFSFYNGNTSEDVFTIQNSATDNGRTGAGGWASYYMPASAGGRGDAPFSQSLIQAFEAEPGDKRFNLKIEGQTAGIDYFFNNKFPDAVNNSDNSPVIRTTEVYLNLAEALAHLSTTPDVQAIDILNNRIRRRAGLGPKSVLTQNELINALLLERRKELAFEGHRRMDMLRNRQNLRGGQASAAFGAPKTILPIPQREIDNNPSLQGQQNEGY